MNLLEVTQHLLHIILQCYTHTVNDAINITDSFHNKRFYL